MGMYTEIVAGIQLKKDAPKVVIDALDYMAGNTDVRPKKLPDHALFKMGRWEIMLQCCSFYFPYHEPLTVFKRGPDFAPECILSVRSSVKNYDGEVEAFFDWITPHCHATDGECLFLGYSRYEEDDDPILYYTTGPRRVRG